MASHDGSAGRLDDLRARAAAVVDAVLGTPGSTSPEARRDAYGGRADDTAVTRYLELVRTSAHRITDADVASLRESGLDDDAIFEVTVAAALGSAGERLDAGLALLRRER